jgi:hypothetical protein
MILANGKHETNRYNQKISKKVLEINLEPYVDDE